MVRGGVKSVPALRVGPLTALKFEGKDGLAVAASGAGFAAPGCDLIIPVSLRRETGRAEFCGVAAGVALGFTPVSAPAVALTLALTLAPTLALGITSAFARARGGAVI